MSFMAFEEFCIGYGETPRFFKEGEYQPNMSELYCEYMIQLEEEDSQAYDKWISELPVNEQAEQLSTMFECHLWSAEKNAQQMEQIDTNNFSHSERVRHQENLEIAREIVRRIKLIEFESLYEQ